VLMLALSPIHPRVRGRGVTRNLNREGRIEGLLGIPEGEPQEPPVRFLTPPTLQDPSEAVRRQPRGSERVSGCVFTVTTEINELPVPVHLHILGAITTTLWSLVRIGLSRKLPARNICRNALETVFR
jgi:hypothetical protein